jgi:hypothetical protein
MQLQQVTEAHSRRQKTLAQRTAAELARLWRHLDMAKVVASWHELLPKAVEVLSTSQAMAAASAGIYTDDALEAQGIQAEAAGLVSAARFAGIASDGRDLRSLLYEPAVNTLLAIRSGDTLDRAKARGLMSLDTITRTQVADAGRAAEAVAIAARPAVTGYVRMLSLPSCSRCVILAGRFYRWNQGFRRHPRCDCRHIPSRENLSGAIVTDPKKAFESMSAAEQDRQFGKAGAEAIRQGASMNKVVNADRGTQVATVFGQQVKATTEGVAKGGPVRLMPEQILLDAKGDRQEVLRLLRLHGYIT